MELSFLASKSLQSPIVTFMELEKLLGGTTDSLYGRIKRMVAQGKLLHIRRGLYCLTEKMGYANKIHPFELAQHIYGASYISLESALSYHKLIPETVFTITSACIKRSREFETPLGVFSYLHLPAENFYVEVDLISNGHFFMAKPWKAICDYVFCYKMDWKNISPLFDSLRIDSEDLPLLYDETIDKLDNYYHSQRISRFLKGIRKDLKNER